MSLFTDPELPPPLTKPNLGSGVGSDADSDMSEEGGSPCQQCWLCRYLLGTMRSVQRGTMRTLRRGSVRASVLFRRRVWWCNAPRSKRFCMLRASTGYKGLTALSVITVVAMVMVLYSRHQVQNIMTQAFAYNSLTLKNVASSQEGDPNLPPHPHPGLSDLAGGSPSDHHSRDEDDTLMEEMEEGVRTDSDNNSSATPAPLELEKMEPMPEMTLHFLWCDHKFLDYRNFLSVKRAVEVIQPHKVMFHYKTLPMEDVDGYFTWFEELKKMYHRVFELSKINSTKTCYSGGFDRYVLLFDILEQYGGIYVPIDSIFIKLADRFRTRSFVSGIGSCNLHYFAEGVVMAKKGEFVAPNTPKAKVKMLGMCHEDDALHPCMPADNFEKLGGSLPSCVRLTEEMFPKSLWSDTDRVSSLAKLVAYGKIDLKPREGTSTVKIPKTAHYLCTDDCTLNFSVFLSILSAIYVGRLDQVLIHGPKEPSGIWWEKLKVNKNFPIHYILRQFSFIHDPQLKMTNEMRRYIMRTEILMHFGGVFHDSHVIWTQALPDELLEYEAVASPDWHAYGNWPESVNHGLLLARAGAAYLQRLLQVYHDNAFTQTAWVADHYLSYRLLEIDPTLLYIHPRLQVKCLNHNCHPTWVPGYRSHFWLNKPGPPFDWRTDTLSIHWVDSFPELDVDQIKFTSGFIVDVAHHVLKEAGVDVNSL